MISDNQLLCKIDDVVMYTGKIIYTSSITKKLMCENLRTGNFYDIKEVRFFTNWCYYYRFYLMDIWWYPYECFINNKSPMFLEMVYGLK